MQIRLAHTQNTDHLYHLLNPLIDTGAVIERIDHEYKYARKFYSLTPKGRRLLDRIQSLDNILPLDIKINNRLCR